MDDRDNRRPASAQRMLPRHPAEFPVELAFSVKRPFLGVKRHQLTARTIDASLTGLGLYADEPITVAVGDLVGLTVDGVTALAIVRRVKGNVCGVEFARAEPRFIAAVDQLIVSLQSAGGAAS